MNDCMKKDIAVIGAGPVGIFTVFQAGMLGMKSVVFDILSEIGGQCSALYPEKPIFDIPAFPEIKAIDLIKNLAKQAAPFNPEYILDSEVVAINKVDDEWELINSKKQIVRAKSIIIATGCGAFKPKKLPLKNATDFENKTLFYSITDLKKFKDKTVTIAGGGDSAVDWSILLSSIAKKVYVIHRRGKFRALPNNVEKMKTTSNIELLIPYVIEGIKGNNGNIKEIFLSTLSGEKKMVKSDYLLPFFGLSMDSSDIENLNINFEKKHIVVNQSSMSTNLPGIFAIGDIAKYPGKLKLILTGFAESAIAVHEVYKIINPDHPLHFEYSTVKGESIIKKNK